MGARMIGGKVHASNRNEAISPAELESGPDFSR